jgi:large subunit ribosomal protein L32
VAEPTTGATEITAMTMNTATFLAPALPAWGALLVPEWLDALWNHSGRKTPKKRTSYSRKRMRSTHKRLKAIQNHYDCPACGAPKLTHRLCPKCLSP